MAIQLSDEFTFKTLYESLKETYRDTLDFGLKVSASVLIVIGWFAAQKNPLPFLCASPALHWLALFLVLVGFLLVCLILRNFYARSQDLYGQLSDRGFEESLYFRLRITSAMFYGGIVGQALLLGGVAWSIVYKYESSIRSTTCAPF